MTIKELWFDVEKRRYTTLAKSKEFSFSCGLM